MAQTGYTPISLYYSTTASTAPTAGNLVAGELALNNNDGRLFYKDNAGVVQVIGTKGGVGSSTTTQVLYNSSGLVVGSANLTFNGTTLTTANDASISGLTVGKGGGAVNSNTAVGYQAGYSNVTGTEIVAVGYQALYSNTGSQSTAVGVQALRSNTSGSNAAFGQFTLYANTTGTANTAFGGYGGSGNQTLVANTTGSYNSAFGMGALATNTTASNNTAVGYQSLYSSNSGPHAALGYKAGYAVTSGTDNIFLGPNAGNATNPTTTGSANIYIGSSTGGSAVGSSYEIAIGFNINAKGSSTGFISPNGGGVYQGNNSTLWSITSDQRLKKNIVDNTVGLDAITKIQVRNFEYRTADEITELPKENAIEIKGVQLGPIAQELAQVLPNCVKTESTGVMSVDASNITWYLVNAIQEQQALITTMQAKLKDAGVLGF